MKLITRLLDWAGIERTEQPKEAKKWARIPSYSTLPEVVLLLQKELDKAETQQLKTAKEYTPGSAPYAYHQQALSKLHQIRVHVQAITKMLYDTPAGGKAMQEAVQVVDWQLGGER